MFDNFFHLFFSIDLLGAESWYNEYKRLTYNIPMVLTDELQYAHSHQVLHVSFSHNGRMFATCSKDGFVHVRYAFNSNSTRVFFLVEHLIWIQLNLIHFFIANILDMEFIVSCNNQILA